ncbi:MAG TPA: hypothetical protein VGQ99_13315 [Tepidisphaeraceae bacterium]|jgi:hypothetical protein|nr:hypothetical protein [Tepidisphaeraceae bacterium]
MAFLRLWLAAVLIVSLGCAAQRPEPPPLRGGEPLGLQMVRTEAQLKKYPFRILQEFEQPVDLAFVQVEGPAAQISATRGHTGTSSALLERETRSATIRLPSLLSGVRWPGQWTLVGAYFFAAKPQRMRAVYEVDGRAILNYAVQIPANQWTPLLLDISAIEGPNASKVGLLRLGFGDGLEQPVWCDDVLLMNNETEVVERKKNVGWYIEERGFKYIIHLSNSTVTLKTPEASDHGWTLVEANEIRARFSSPGPEKQRVIYADGKQYIDGVLKPLGVKPSIVVDLAAGHDVPGRLRMGEEFGRLNRNSAGDQNNDGYDESRGSYQIIATGPRLEFTLSPRSGPLIRPVVEIAGLPAGPVSVTMDGRWVERIVRLENGNVLIELPGEVAFPVTVNVKVGQ